MGGLMGSALLSTYQTYREQAYSVALVQQINPADPTVAQRLHGTDSRRDDDPYRLARVRKAMLELVGDASNWEAEQLRHRLRDRGDALAPVLAPVHGDEDMAATLHPTADVMALAHPQLRVHHRIAGHQDVARGDPLTLQRLRCTQSGREVKAADAADHLPQSFEAMVAQQDLVVEIPRYSINHAKEKH